jgi:purine nucleosidase
MKKIIIDTDIGDDIDDALALQMALNSPELDILGVTTVFTNSHLRSRIARKLMKENGRNIPVFTGCSKPIAGDWGHHLPCQYDATMHSPPTLEYEEDAIKFLIETVNKHPGKVTIVAIGMLTNIARAISSSPDFCRNVKQIALMGGVISAHYSEWNIRWDPEAAYTVFHSGIPIIMVGLDVTMACSISLEEAYSKLKESRSASSAFICTLIERWESVGINHRIVLHDPLVIAILLDDSVVVTQKRRVSVELQGSLTRGMTFGYQSPFHEEGPPLPEIEVCMEVDATKVVNLVRERVFS